MSSGMYGIRLETIRTGDSERDVGPIYDLLSPWTGEPESTLAQVASATLPVQGRAHRGQGSPHIKAPKRYPFCSKTLGRLSAPPSPVGRAHGARNER